MIENKSNLLQEINDVITESNIAQLNLELGKEYLITFDIEQQNLSLNLNFQEVIYIKNITFESPSKAKNDLLNNTLFERFLSGNELNLTLEFLNNFKVFFDYEKIRQIKLGLEDSLEVSKYTMLNAQGEPIFDFNQMRQIRLGLEDDIDISKYTLINSNEESILDYKQMWEIRKSLENI